MSNKTKNNTVADFIDGATDAIVDAAQDATEQVTDVVQKLGLAAMGTAAVIGAVQVADRNKLERSAVLPIVPILVPADTDTGNQNTLRREREESGPHYVSYTEAQRTPSRSGKH